jgi:hypothetical protein
MARKHYDCRAGGRHNFIGRDPVQLARKFHESVGRALEIAAGLSAGRSRVCGIAVSPDNPDLVGASVGPTGANISRGAK